MRLPHYASLALLLLQTAVAASSTSSTTTLSSATSKSSSTITSTDDSSSTDGTMPTITATSSSTILDSSTLNVTFSAIVPTGYNPYVSHETLPVGLPFIVVGGFFGLILLAMIMARMVLWCVSYRAAKKTLLTEKQAKEYNYDPSIFQEVPLKNNYSHSVYSLSSHSTLNVLASTQSLENLNTQGQGRTYRSAVTRASRSSMFISPTEMLQMGGYDGYDGYDGYSNPAAAGYLSNYDSPIDSPTSSTPYSPQPYKKKTSRPPSVYMDHLLDGDLDDLDSSGSSFDSHANEKV